VENDRTSDGFSCVFRQARKGGKDSWFSGSDEIS